MIAELGRRMEKYLPDSTMRVIRPAYFSIRDIEKHLYYKYKNDEIIIDTDYGFQLAIHTADYAQNRFMTGQDVAENVSADFFYDRAGDIDGDFVDVGAHVGFYSLLFCSNNAGTVYAFEPLSYCVERLNRNIHLNETDRVKVFPIGLSDEQKRNRIHFKPENTGGTEDAHDSWLNIHSEEVQFEALDDVTGLSDEISLIKIDVEGHEFDVLRGGADVIERSHPEMMIEVHPRKLRNRGQSVEQVLSLIFALGYDSICLLPDMVEYGHDEALNSLERVAKSHSIWCGD